MATENTAWQLEDFVDSLVVDLDKTRETLAIKAINKPLSYTVKELALDLNIFPSYDGDQVKFITAQPGQQDIDGHDRYEKTQPAAGHAASNEDRSLPENGTRILRGLAQCYTAATGSGRA